MDWQVCQNLFIFFDCYPCHEYPFHIGELAYYSDSGRVPHFDRFISCEYKENFRLIRKLTVLKACTSLGITSSNPEESKEFRKRRFLSGDLVAGDQLRRSKFFWTSRTSGNQSILFLVFFIRTWRFSPLKPENCPSLISSVNNWKGCPFRLEPDRTSSSL